MPAARGAGGLRRGAPARGLYGDGHFEQCHFLMGFENALTSLYEHPREMHELIEYITEYRLDYVRRLIDGLQPDVIFSHDDWGTKDALFMRPEMWREFFKEPYRRFYGYIRSRGVITIHHADSYLVPIVDDMAEIGIQVWQGVLPENDIPALQRHLNGRIVLMGGFGAAIDRADAQPDEIRAYAADTLRRCCPGGHFIPSITYGVPGAVFPAYRHLSQRGGRRLQRAAAYAGGEPAARPAPPSRRTARRTCCGCSGGGERSPARHARQDCAGARARAAKARAPALRRRARGGQDAQEILSDGLMRGMTQLGEDFSANRAFVPEMLLAARCMAAATELLKPHLTAGGTETIGRVCLGTVRGDMHDIGKNLVKIMFEGSGLEVVDLGVDVAPERFIDAAKAQQCGIIACSSLLTTTMQEMRRVVELAEEAGIRGSVKIMVGGAPISQSFCDEIGADVYTVCRSTYTPPLCALKQIEIFSRTAAKTDARRARTL